MLPLSKKEVFRLLEEVVRPKTIGIVENTFFKVLFAFVRNYRP